MRQTGLATGSPGQARPYRFTSTGIEPAETTFTIGPQTTLTPTVTWTPQAGGHVCVRVELRDVEGYSGGELVGGIELQFEPEEQRLLYLPLVTR